VIFYLTTVPSSKSNENVACPFESGLKVSEAQLLPVEPRLFIDQKTGWFSLANLHSCDSDPTVATNHVFQIMAG
jgi:hypothetical protein